MYYFCLRKKKTQNVRHHSNHYLKNVIKFNCSIIGFYQVYFRLITLTMTKVVDEIEQFFGLILSDNVGGERHAIIIRDGKLTEWILNIFVTGRCWNRGILRSPPLFASIKRYITGKKKRIRQQVELRF